MAASIRCYFDTMQSKFSYKFPKQSGFKTLVSEQKYKNNQKNHKPHIIFTILIYMFILPQNPVVLPRL